MYDDTQSQEEEDNTDIIGSGGKLDVAEDDQSINMTIYFLLPVATLILCIYCAFLVFSKRKKEKRDQYVRIIYSVLKKISILVSRVSQ